MSRIQFIDLDTSSNKEETGGVIISKHEMRTRLEWFNSKEVPQVKQESEKTDAVEDVTKTHEAVQIQNQPPQSTQEGQPEDQLASIDTHKVMEGIDNDSVETDKEQENIKEESYHIENKEESLTKSSTSSTEIQREIEQLTTTKLAVDIKRKEAEPQESDTPVEENEEGMLLEDCVLLTYILKRTQEDSEIKSIDSSTKPEAKVAKEDVDYKRGKVQVCSEYVVYMPISGDSHEIGENLQKLCGTKEVVGCTTIVPLTSSPVVEDEDILEEEAMRNQPVIPLTMVDKLTKMVKNLGSEISKEKTLKVPAIDLMLRIQAVLDECGSFPENNTVNILDIINMITDKSVVAWKEKLDGGTEIDSCETKTLAQSIMKESHTKDQERKQEAKDMWIMQKCTNILQNASRTYEFAAKTAAGLANLAGMCDG